MCPPLWRMFVLPTPQFHVQFLTQFEKQTPKKDAKLEKRKHLTVGFLEGVFSICRALPTIAWVQVLFSICREQLSDFPDFFPTTSVLPLLSKLPGLFFQSSCWPWGKSIFPCHCKHIKTGHSWKHTHTHTHRIQLSSVRQLVKKITFLS